MPNFLRFFFCFSFKILAKLWLAINGRRFTKAIVVGEYAYDDCSTLRDRFWEQHSNGNVSSRHNVSDWSATIKAKNENKNKNIALAIGAFAEFFDRRRFSNFFKYFFRFFMCNIYTFLVGRRISDEFVFFNFVIFFVFFFCTRNRWSWARTIRKILFWGKFFVRFCSYTYFAIHFVCFFRELNLYVSSFSFLIDAFSFFCQFSPVFPQRPVFLENGARFLFSFDLRQK